MKLPSRSPTNMRRLAVSGVLLAAASVALVVAALVGSPEEQPVRIIGLVVDRNSVGGHCADVRTVDENSARTPWCSLDRALAAAPAGSTIALRRGEYPFLQVEGLTRKKYVTIRPAQGDGGRVSLGGARFFDAGRFRIEGVRISGGVEIDRSSGIQLVGNDVTPKGIAVRPGSRNISVVRNKIHDIARTQGANDPDGNAIWVSGGEGRIDNVVIRDNKITRVPIDAIQLGSTHGAVVEGNDIAEVHAAPGFSGDHPDSLQILNGSGFRIRGNYIHDNAGGLQLEAGLVGLVIENNLLVHNDGYGINVGEPSRLKLIGNTIWDNGFGGVVLVDDPATPIKPRNIVLANNILQTLQGSERSFFSFEDYNVIPRDVWFGRHDTRRAPTFVSKKGRNAYQLAPRSVGIDAGVSENHGFRAPSRDRLGRRRLDNKSERNTGAGSRPIYDLGAHERTP